jgi:RNA polymerase sigma factor (sigma-70 family)
MAEDVDAARISKRDFATTHWSVVLAARVPDAKGAGEALGQLCETYWYPVYAYVRRRVTDPHEAQDFTQAFFAHLLEKQSIADADESRGRFRTFLLTACKRFLINEWHKAKATKRGGGVRHLSLDFDSGESKYSLVATDATSAEQLYNQQWAVALLDRTLEKLDAEYAARQRLPYFQKLKAFLAGSGDVSSYKSVAQELGISEANAKVAAHRLRNRYRELLKAEIADTVHGGGSVDDEVRDLFAAFGSPKC